MPRALHPYSPHPPPNPQRTRLISFLGLGLHQTTTSSATCADAYLTNSKCFSRENVQLYTKTDKNRRLLAIAALVLGGPESVRVVCFTAAASSSFCGAPRGAGAPHFYYR